MTKRILTLTVLIMNAVFGFCQTPQWINADHVNINNRVACNNSAGTCVQTLLAGAQTKDKVYLCFGDNLAINHDGNMNLTGDPVPATPSGVTYIFYKNMPTVTGMTKADIEKDPALQLSPSTGMNPASGYYVVGMSNTLGNAVFVNDSSLQKFFKNGAPYRAFFAPATFDYLKPNAGGTAFTVEYEGGGPCVNVNIANKFEAVYLNTIKEFVQSPNGASLTGRVNLRGGLPEYDATSSYVISIVNKADATVKGTVTSGAAKHNAIMTFTVPKTGTYLIAVQDAKGCTLKTFEMQFTELQAPSVAISSGSPICTDITTTDFTALQSMQFALEWDPLVVAYTSIKNINPALNSTFATLFAPQTGINNYITFNWADLTNTPLTLPAGSKLFTICYNAIGAAGTKSFLTFSGKSLGAGIELTDKNDRQAGFKLSTGVINITAGGNSLDLVLQADSVTCFGNSDAKIKVIPSGGTTPYTYSWKKLPLGTVNNAGAITGSMATIPNVGKGDYEVTITDATGTTITRTVNVYQSPSPLAASTSKTDPTCASDANGSVTANVIGGTPPYSYAWSNSVVGPINVIDKLLAGTYSVTITDATGCTSSSSQSIAPKYISFSKRTVFDASCTGKKDGSISVDIQGGSSLSGNYKIEWSTGIKLTASTSTINALTNSTYYVTVTDDNNCVFKDTFFIGAKKQINIQTQVLQNINCNGDKSGELSLLGTTVGGAAAVPYIFSWSPNVGTQQVTGNVWTLKNIKAGTYKVTMTDAVGCVLSKDYTITQPDSILVNITKKNVSCTPGSDGEVALAVSGGKLNAGSQYKYKWKFNNATTPSLTGLKAGFYAVTVTDDNGCTKAFNVAVTNPNGPKIAAIDTSKVDCSNSTNGSLEAKVTAAAGTTIASYSWTNLTDGKTYSGAKINNLTTGKYVITVTDNKTCADIDTAYVIAPAPIAIADTTLKNPTCPGNDDGQISLVGISGGNPAYIYKWKKQGDPNFTTAPIAVISNLKAGVFEFEVTDQKGCAPAKLSVTLNDPSKIKMTIDNIKPVKCNGQIPCDGLANISASGGTGSGTYTFTWLSTGGVNVGTSSSNGFLCQGKQLILIKDENCNITDSLIIPAPPKLELSKVTTVKPTCFGTKDGELTVEAQGGQDPYIYKWDTGVTDKNIKNIGSGNYILTITDNNGCALDTAVFLAQPAELKASIVPAQTQNSTCSNSNDGIVSVQFTGGTKGSMTYKWNPAVSDTAVAINLSPGIYTITVSDVNGCSSNTSYIVSAPPPITFTLAPIARPQCFGYSTVVKLIDAKGGVGTNLANYTFTIDDGSVGQDSLSAQGGPHTVKVFDPNGCFTEDSIYIEQPKQVTVNLGVDKTVALGDSIRLNPNIGSEFGIASYLYTPGTYLSCTTCKKPYCVPLEDTKYKLVVVDSMGCSGFDEVLVEVDKERNIFVPNAFSPNADGTNDIFRVFAGVGVLKINMMQIYDRWGELIFDQNTSFTPAQAYDIGWDGNHRGKPATQDTYVYIIEVEFLDNVKLLYRGDVYLLR